MEDYASEPLSLIRKRKGIHSLLGIRFLAAGFIISLILFSLGFDSYLRSIEVSTLTFILKSLGVSAHHSAEDLFIGHALVSQKIRTSIHMQLIFYIFFFTLAVTVSTSIKRRLEILGFGILCYIVFIALDLMLILMMNGFRILAQTSFLHATIIIQALIGSAMIELMLYKVLILPPPVKLKRVIKRSYRRQYFHISISLIVAFFITYFIMNLLQINIDSPVNTFIGINLASIQFYSIYFGYIWQEIRTPTWAKIPRKEYAIVTFLIPAYNEERFITRCIESIDAAASMYKGTTEIIIVNDGSTDHTSDRAHEAISNLRYSKGMVIDKPNTGKADSLNQGLKVSSGEVIFRIDADSVIDKNAIDPILRHFNDPQVGSVAGMIFALEERYIWQKFLMTTMGEYIFSRRSQEFYDTIMVQPGVFSVFRRSVILKLNGWSEGTLGEDRDVTLRIARLGYKNEFEHRAFVRSDIPRNLSELRRQRTRWGMGFYHSHSRNLNVMKESIGPRSFFSFPLELITHGAGFISFLSYAYILAGLVLGYNLHFTDTGLLGFLGFPINLVVIEIVTFFLQYIILIYFLIRNKRYRLLSLVPILKVYQIVLQFFVMEATDILFISSDRFERRREKLRVQDI